MHRSRTAAFGLRLVVAAILGAAVTTALGCGHTSSGSGNSLMSRASRLSRLEFGAEEPVVSPMLAESPPTTVAVLPFRSRTKQLGKISGMTFKTAEEQEAYERKILTHMRRQFYGHFSPREFIDIEIKLIDLLLEREGIDPQRLDEVPSEYLGSLLGADALIYGKVTRYRVIHGLIVSRVNIGLEVRMVSTSTGTVLWRAKDVRCKNNWMASTSVVPVVFGVYSSTVEVTDDHVARSVDFLCEKIIATLPEVDLPAVYGP